jgi:hypothetical protein
MFQIKGGLKAIKSKALFVVLVITIFNMIKNGVRYMMPENAIYEISEVISAALGSQNLTPTGCGLSPAP